MAEVTKGPNATEAVVGAKREGRSPAFVYSALATAVVVLIAALTITASQTPPPAIAELAPAAVQQITNAPPGQTSSAGEGEGGAGGGDLASLPTTTTTPTPAAEIRQAPRTRKCITEPGFAPRQTEDPQSPPCVPLWEGTNNGGATSKGVTRDEITVAVPFFGEPNRNYAGLEAYFNKRYEFYGRKIRLVGFKQAPAYTTGDKMEGDAVKADEEVKAFAAVGYGLQRGQEGVYFNALARRGIVSVAASFGGPPSSTEADFAKNAPYQWNYYAPIDLVERNMAEVICNQLVGKPAAFAGGAEAAKQRRFGLIIDAAVNGAPPITGEPLLSITKRCGALWDVNRIAFRAPDIQFAAAEDTKNAVTQMQGSGVTTIVCLCQFNYIAGAMQSANSASPPYQPEWFVQNFGVQDHDQFAPSYPGLQSDHVFGLRTYNKALPRAESPHWMAKKEVDPTDPPNIQNYDNNYWNLLVLSSGIQLAGPNLTPKTFEQGLQRAKFPNPNCGKAPVYQACVGFEGGTHTMIKDFSMVWWDPNGRSLEHDYTLNSNAYFAAKGQGAYCYAELGTRRGLGRWPDKTPPMFGTTACR